MAKAGKRAVAVMNSLEGAIMETRQRIDRSSAEIERRLRRALDARYLLTRYKTALTIAGFGLGFLIGLGALKLKRPGGQRAAGAQTLASALVLKVAAPVATELLLRRIKKSDR